MIENSQVSFSQNIGISLNYGPSVVAPSKTGSGSGVTHRRYQQQQCSRTATVVHYPRNLAELYSQKLMPGVVVQSNVLATTRVTGIQITGLPNNVQTSSADPVPFDRIVNNTIFGGTLQKVESTDLPFSTVWSSRWVQWHLPTQCRRADTTAVQAFQISMRVPIALLRSRCFEQRH